MIEFESEEEEEEVEISIEHESVSSAESSTDEHMMQMAQVFSIIVRIDTFY